MTASPCGPVGDNVPGFTHAARMGRARSQPNPRRLAGPRGSAASLAATIPGPEPSSAEVP